MAENIDNNTDVTFLQQLSVEKADVAILPLVKRFFNAQGMRAQAARGDDVYIVRDAGQRIVAALRLCPIDKYWLLRSMCVEQKLQRRGVGRYLLKTIQPELIQKACYSFPYIHLQPFYQQAGFSCCEPVLLPGVIEQRYRQYLEQGKKIIAMQVLADTAGTQVV